jgi:hypothetical protein
VAPRWARAIVTGGDNLIYFKFKMIFNQIQIISNFDCPKKDLHELKKFEIKYGCEGLEERNNFLHRNFFIFGMHFK